MSFLIHDVIVECINHTNSSLLNSIIIMSFTEATETPFRTKVAAKTTSLPCAATAEHASAESALAISNQNQVRSFLANSVSLTISCVKDPKMYCAPGTANVQMVNVFANQLSTAVHATVRFQTKDAKNLEKKHFARVTGNAIVANVFVNPPTSGCFAMSVLPVLRDVRISWTVYSAKCTRKASTVPMTVV